MIVLVRCDDRLIHGQCMTVLVKGNRIEQIIVVDNLTASNSILRSVFKAAVPADMRAGVYTVDEAAPLIREAMGNSTRTLVLMKSPETYRDLLDRVDGLPLELNVGPMSKRKGTTEVHAAAHLLPVEAQAVRDVVARGARVYFQQVPSQPVIEWDDVKDRF